MYKYKFEFENLLKIKKQKEDNLKNTLSAENKRLELDKKNLNNLIKEKNEEINIFKSNNKVIKISDIQTFYDYLEKLNKLIESKEEKIEMRKNKINNIRNDLIDVSKEKQMLEKIEEEKLLKYKSDLIKDEQKINDEVSSYRYFIKNL